MSENHLDGIREWIEAELEMCDESGACEPKNIIGGMEAGYRRTLAALEEAMDHCGRGMLGMFQREMHKSILRILRDEQQEIDDGKG